MPSSIPPSICTCAAALPKMQLSGAALVRSQASGPLQWWAALIVRGPRAHNIRSVDHLIHIATRAPSSGARIYWIVSLLPCDESICALILLCSQQRGREARMLREERQLQQQQQKRARRRERRSSNRQIGSSDQLVRSAGFCFLRQPRRCRPFVRRRSRPSVRSASLRQRNYPPSVRATPTPGAKFGAVFVRGARIAICGPAACRRRLRSIRLVSF